MQKQKIMITGNEGFIGTHLTNHLKEKGYDVVGYNRENDVLNNFSIDNFMNLHKPDIIIHLAANAFVPTSIENPRFDLATNVRGTINMLEAAVKNKIKLFIFPSTAGVYGRTENRIREVNPPYPENPYSIGKLAAEYYVNFYNRQYGVPTIIFRMFNVFGKNQRDCYVVPKLIKEIKEGKKLALSQDTRDFIYIKDICRAFELAVKKMPVGETINIGTGKETSMFELAKSISLKLKKDFEFDLIESQPFRSFAEISKAIVLLGWIPEYSLDQGIKEMMK